MPLLCGPMNSRFTYTGSPCPHLDLAVATDATTLGAALRDYEARFHARIVQCQDPRIAGAEAANKYFEYLDLKSGSMQLVDVHVLRGDQEICPKRDLAFALEPDDLVDIGELIC